jgi:hypothetical protein
VLKITRNFTKKKATGRISLCVKMAIDKAIKRNDSYAEGQTLFDESYRNR